MSDFLKSLSECLEMGGLDPSINIRIGQDGQLILIDTSKVLVSNHEQVQKIKKEFAESVDPRIQKLMDDDCELYFEELNSLIGEEYKEKHGLDVVEFNKTIQQFETTKTTVNELEESYKDTVRTINFNEEWIEGERDENLIETLKKENESLREKATTLFDKINELKFGLHG
jgi:hypothetical protein